MSFVSAMAEDTVSSIMDVVVVGCGASGVAALRLLHDAGLRVLGLEAAGRIGGRICTVPFADGVVDLGAQWCHGERDNAVYTLVKDLGVLDRPTTSEQIFLLSDGSTSTEGRHIVDKLQAIVDSGEKRNAVSISERLRLAIQEQQITENSSLLTAYLEWFERFNHIGGQDNASRAKSLRGLEECWPCEGEFLLNWKDRGFKTILDILLKEYPNIQEKISLEILLNKEVETIKWQRSKPVANSTNPLVQIVCKDGSMYAARFVIVTVSIAVLRERYQDMFKPALPVEKVTAIENLQMCILDKIYVQFTQPWWPKLASYFSTVWKPQDKKDKDFWVTEIYGASTVEYQPNVMCFWIYGEGAKAMEKCSLKGIEEGVLTILKIFFINYKVSAIKDIKRSRWWSDRLTRGAYSYRCVDTEIANTDAATLSEPLRIGDAPAVCFAGEATSWHRHGAVHGAVEAGCREAKRVIDFMRAE